MPEPTRDATRLEAQSPPAGGDGEKKPQEARPTAVPAPAVPEAKPTQYRASLFQGPQKVLPPAFVSLVQQLEEALGMPVWLLSHCFDNKCGNLDDQMVLAFFGARDEMEPGKPVALLIDSAGGYARSAYQLAMLFRKHCGEFVAVVPRYAKSAATLLALEPGTSC